MVAQNGLDEPVWMVVQWAGHNNSVASTLIRLAVNQPWLFEAVSCWDDLLYTAVTNTLWVQTSTNSYTIMSFRETKGLIAILGCLIAGPRRIDFIDDPNGSAVQGGDDLPNNAMHLLLGALGFHRALYPNSQNCFKKYSCGYGPRPTEIPLNIELDGVWMMAVKAWVACSKNPISSVK